MTDFIDDSLGQVAQGKFQPPAASYPLVAPHPAPDSSGAMINMSDSDWLAFQAGKPPPPAQKPTAAIDAANPPPAATPPEPQTTSSDFDVEDALRQVSKGTFKAPVAAPPKGTGFMNQVGYGAQEGVYGLANVPTQIPRMIGEAGTDLYNWITGKNAQNPTPTFAPPQPLPEPVNTPERFGRAIGQGLPSIPLMAAAPVAEAGSLGLAALNAGRSAATTAAPVIAGQIGGQAAVESVPEKWADPARTAAQLLTGGLAGVGQEIITTPTQAGIRAAGAAGIGPRKTIQADGGPPVRVTNTQQNMVADRMRAAASPGTVTAPSVSYDPTTETLTVSFGAGGSHTYTNVSPTVAKVFKADPTGDKPNGAELQTALTTNPETLVPGSNPTTAQLAQRPGAPLPGIAKLEDTVRASGGGPAFMTRDTAQNEARVASIKNAGVDLSQGPPPPSAPFDPAAVGKFFKDQLAALDAKGQAEIANAQTAVKQGSDALGGYGTPTGYGRDMRGAINDELSPVQVARRQLWDSVDPKGTLTVETSPIQTAIRQIKSELRRSDTLTAGENAVMAHASSLDRVAPFRDLQVLRKNVLDASRQEANGEPLTTQGMRRMTILKQAIDEAFAQSIEQRAAQEAEAVANGQLRPEETIAGRLGQQAPSHYWHTPTADTPVQVVSPTSLPGPGSNSGQRFLRVRDVATGEEHWAPEEEIRQGEPPQPTYDEKAAATYAAAREATIKEKQRFGQGAVGDVLARGKNGTPTKVLDADVPAQFFTGRPSEPGEVQGYLNAVGTQKGVALARDYLVSDLRSRGIIDEDGLVKADMFAKWQSRKAETIKLFPGLEGDFTSVEAAQRTLDNVQAAHTAALKEYQDGAAKQFLNEEPERAVQKMLNSADRSKLMQQTYDKVKGDPDALESLKGHILNYIVDKMTTSAKSGEEVGRLRDAYKDWITENTPWLRRFYGGQGVNRLVQVGADLQRAQMRTMASGNSATIERGGEVLAHGGGVKQHLPSLLGILAMQLGEMAAETAGLHGLKELAVGAGAAATPALASVLRQAGIKTRNDLLREAMLHPSLARELLQRAPTTNITTLMQRRIAHAFQAVLLSSGAGSQTNLEHP